MPAHGRNKNGPESSDGSYKEFGQTIHPAELDSSDNTDEVFSDQESSSKPVTDVNATHKLCLLQDTKGKCNISTSQRPFQQDLQYQPNWDKVDINSLNMANQISCDSNPLSQSCRSKNDQFVNASHLSHTTSCPAKKCTQHYDNKSRFADRNIQLNCFAHSKSAPLPKTKSLFSGISQEDYNRWKKSVEELGNLLEEFDRRLSSTMEYLNINKSPSFPDSSYVKSCNDQSMKSIPDIPFHSFKSTSDTYSQSLKSVLDILNMFSELALQIETLFEQLIIEFLIPVDQFLEQLIDLLINTRYNLEEYIEPTFADRKPDSYFCGFQQGHSSFPGKKSNKDHMCQTSESFGNETDEDGLSKARRMLSSCLNRVFKLLSNRSSTATEGSFPVRELGSEQIVSSLRRSLGSLQRRLSSEKCKKCHCSIDIPESTDLKSGYFPESNQENYAGSTENHGTKAKIPFVPTSQNVLDKKPQSTDKNSEIISDLRRFLNKLEGHFTNGLVPSNQNVDERESDTRSYAPTSSLSLESGTAHIDNNLPSASFPGHLQNINNVQSSIDFGRDEQLNRPVRQVRQNMNASEPVNRSVHDFRPDAESINQPAVISNDRLMHLQNSFPYNNLNQVPQNQQEASQPSQIGLATTIGGLLNQLDQRNPYIPHNIIFPTNPMGSLFGNLPSSIQPNMYSPLHSPNRPPQIFTIGIRRLVPKGLSMQKIQALPTMKYEDINPTLVYEISQCRICLSDFMKSSVLRVLPCKHAFHKDCIDAWLSTNKTCPVCSTEI